MNIREIPWRNPYAAFAPLVDRPHAHFLHGGEQRASGWSIIVAEPVRLLTLKGGDPDAWLGEVQEIANRRRIDAIPTASGPFHSGLVGYVGYEALAALEPTLRLPCAPYALPEAHFGVYDAAATFSRQDRRAFISGRSDEATARLELLLGGDELDAPDAEKFYGLESNFSRADYESTVAEVTERIRNGDFFQANIAQTLKARTENPFSVYSLLRAIAAKSDADFLSLFQYEEGAILSNSPERFFKLTSDRKITAEPVKGTRPRSDAPQQDAIYAEELVNDAKDRAENIMIADLMRNDLSRICDDHSIREEAICELMSLSRVHHLVSRISGRLRTELGISDIFRSLFPSGSITGAPKIEAMKTISEIEGRGRGPYCGALGYIDDTGRADFSVGIRTMITDAARREIDIPVGGGITLRSNPSAEYEETLVKASAALSALGLAADAL